MAAAVRITRTGHTAEGLRDQARQSTDGAKVRRLLALAFILDGHTREAAAAQSGMDRQTLRDWVHRYNGEGVAGLSSIRAGRRPPVLTEAQMAELKAVTIEGPDPVTDKPKSGARICYSGRIARIVKDMMEGHALSRLHPAGEQPLVEVLSDQPVPIETYAGRVHVEWDPDASVTPLGQMAFFIAFLKTSGLFDNLVAACPLRYTSPNAPAVRDVLGTTLLSILSGHRRYAHITALRADTVNPPLLGMRRVLSEDAIRRAFEKIEAEAGIAWLREQLDYTTRPLLGEPWILDADTTVKLLYGEQEGAVLGDNPGKPGRPSHSYHSYMMANLRLMLEVEVQSGNQTTAKHSAADLWALLDRLGPGRQPGLLRGDNAWGNEGVMREAEQRGLAYLFRLRLTPNVTRAIERAMAAGYWEPAGQGWEGQSIALRLLGWSRQRRVVLLRRKLDRPVAISEHGDDGQQRLSFATVDPRKKVWEFAALVTSVDAEILTLGQLYRDRAGSENDFDELKNQWGWGGFTTQDLKRCRLMARFVALVFNWWTLFARLADPDHHREAVTTRPLLLTAIGRQTSHAGQTTIRVSSAHAKHGKARQALTRIGAFLESLLSTAEQLTPLDRWYRILSEALVKYLKGRQLDPPRRLHMA